MEKILLEISARRLILVKTPPVMAVAVRYFKFDKAQRDKLLITEDPSLMFSTAQVARDQTRPGSLLARSGGGGGGKGRDPENEVDEH